MKEITGGRTWVLGLLVVPALLGFVFLDGGVGLLLGVGTAAALIVLAVRAKPDGWIEIATPGPGVPGGILVIVLAAIEEPRVAGVVAAIGDPSREAAGEAGLLVLAPVRVARLDRWTGDLEHARFESQRVLTVTLATLATAGIEAEGRVGDGNVVVAAEDTLRSYAASEIVVVAAEGESENEIAVLERRVQGPVRRVKLG